MGAVITHRQGLTEGSRAGLVLIARLLLALYCITYLASSYHLVHNAVDRAQMYAGICITADPQCRVDAGVVVPGDAEHYKMNLGINLVAPVRELLALPMGMGRHEKPETSKPLLARLSAPDIFHPPKR